MVDYILKYRTSNLIMIYYYVYSGLSDITESVVWNSIELIRGLWSCPWVDRQLEYNVCNLC